MNFEYEYIEKMKDVRKHIQECEGHHTKQAIYSTFHDAQEECEDGDYETGLYEQEVEGRTHRRNPDKPRIEPLQIEWYESFEELTPRIIGQALERHSDKITEIINLLNSKKK